MSDATPISREKWDEFESWMKKYSHQVIFCWAKPTHEEIFAEIQKHMDQVTK
jgi:hypothetical protein